MVQKFEDLHRRILTDLAVSPISHSAKAAILFSEALHELRSGIEQGEIQDAGNVWSNVLDVMSHEVSPHIHMS